MQKNPIDVSAVVAAVSVITNDPAPGTTFLSVAVASFVLSTAKQMLVAETIELVTVTVVPAAAMFTVPEILLIVWFPVVPPAVLVAGNVNTPVD